MENRGISFKEFSVTCYCTIIFMISEFAMILHALHTCILTMPIVGCTYIIGTLQEQCLSSLTADVIVYTRPLAVLCCRRSPGCTRKAQLTTYFIGIIDTPVIITNCTPLPAVINLNTAIKSFARKLRRCLKNSHIERKVRDKTTKLCFYTNNKVE